MDGTTGQSGIYPLVSTETVTNLSSTKEYVTGKIQSTGDSPIIERGIYYSTTQGFLPPEAGIKLSETGFWTEPGEFGQELPMLKENTTYYVRAFATNSFGTAYGNEISLTKERSISMVGIDFNLSSSSSYVPTNWNNIYSTGLSGNLMNEDGAYTNAKVEVDPSVSFYFSDPTLSTIPSYTTNLTKIGGHIYKLDPDPNLFMITISGLRPFYAYEVWVMGIRYGRAINQTVMINGASSIMFNQQSPNSLDLIVNDQVGSLSQNFLSYAKNMTADSFGRIDIEVYGDFDISGYYCGLAGIAIKGDIELLPPIQPTIQATNVVFSSTTCNSTSLSWTRGNGENCAVFMQADSGEDFLRNQSDSAQNAINPIDPILTGASPVDLITYIANPMFGNGTQIGSSGWYCVYNGSGASVDVTGLSPNTTYNVHVCEYNGEPGSELYLTNSTTNNPRSFTTPYPYYMAKNDGNWSTPNTWYLSGTYSLNPNDYTVAATEYPTASNSNGIIINDDVLVDVDVSIDQTTINGGHTLTVDNGVTLVTTSGESISHLDYDLTIEGTLVNNGTLVFDDGSSVLYEGFEGTVVGAEYYYLRFAGNIPVDLSFNDFNRKADPAAELINVYTLNGDVSTSADCFIENGAVVDVGTHSLIISYYGGAALDLGGSVTISTGTFGVDQMNDSSGSITFTDAGNMYFYGGTNGTYTFNCGTSTTHYSGPLYQEIYPTTYYNLVLGSSQTDEISEMSKFPLDGSREITKEMLGNIDINGNLTIHAGNVLDVSSNNYQINLAGDWTDYGSFYGQNGTVVFDGNHQTISAETFYNVTIEGTGTKSIAGNVEIANNFIIAENTTWDCDQYTLSLGGLWTQNGVFVAGTGTIVYNSDGDQSVIAENYYNLQLSTGGTKVPEGVINIGGDLIIDNGVTFDVSPADQQINLAGDWTNNGTFVARNGTVVLEGTGGQSVSGTNSFYNLTINNSGNTGVDASGSTLAVTNSLNILDGLFLSASDYHDVTISAEGTLQLSGDITVSGDWDNSGTLAAGTYLVTLDGTDQSISGSTIFYDLKKNVTSAATLTFEAGSTQTIINSLDLQGAADNLLSLRSDTDGTQWIIDVPATDAANCTIAYIDIKDSNNIGEEVQAHHTNSVDSGNNNGWNFNYVPYLTTQEVTDIMHFSATGNGTITDIGNGPATQYGICWSTETNPTIDDPNDFYTEEGVPSGTGAFSSILTGLEEGTTYYVRAYATGSYGTGYGNEVSFTTNNMPDFVYNGTTYYYGGAIDVEVNTDEDNPLVFDLQVTDSDPAQTFIWSYTANTHGTVAINNTSPDNLFRKLPTDNEGSSETRQITFTPTANYHGDAEFTIQVGDGVSTEMSELTFNVTVNPVNDVPVCTVDPAITGNLYVNETLNCTQGTWNDDLDVDNSIASPAYAFNPTFTYQWQVEEITEDSDFVDIEGATNSTFIVPDTFYNRTVRCQVTCTDDGEGTPVAQASTVVSNEVTILNTAPVFVYNGTTYESGSIIAISTDEDVELEFDLTVDDDNANQNFSWNHQNEAHGSITITDPETDVKSTETKHITYQPDLDYYGNDSFVIIVSDNITDASSSLTFNLTISAINDAPVNTEAPVVSGDLHVNETLNCTQGTWNDNKDINGSTYSWTPTYTYQWQQSSDNVTFSDITDATGSSFVIPDNFFELYVRCEVTATDAGFGIPETNSATVASNAVQILNTAPEFVYDGTTYVSGSVIELDSAENTDLVFELMVHDDNAGQNISWISQDEEHGTVSIDDVPTDDPTEVIKLITFTPETNYLGAAGFTISVTDVMTDATSTLEVDLIIKPYNVYVDDDWTGYTYGATVQDTLVYGQKAFENINDAVNGVAPTGIIHVLAGTHGYGVFVNKSLTLTTTDDAILTYFADDYSAALVISEDDVTVTGFVFQNVEDAVIGSGENIVITGNEFINCTNGVTNTGTDIIDASRNWWGDLRGPKHSNNPNYSTTNGTIISDYVTFYPWKATETVTEESEYVKVYEDETDALVVIAVSDVIQTGIDAAVAGNIVEVTDGIYTEDLTIDKGIILRSENGRDLTTIQQTNGIGISIGGNANNFVLGGTGVGFTILSGDNTTQVIRIEGAPSDVSIIDNEIDSEGYAFEGVSINSTGTTNLTISNNGFLCDNGDSGIWLPNSTNVTITDNSFICTGYPISGWAVHINGNINPIVTGNVIANFNIGINLSCGAGFSGGEIRANTITECPHSIYISQWSPSASFGTMQNVELSENTIYSDQVAVYIGDGTYIDASTFIVQYNNFLPAATDDTGKMVIKANKIGKVDDEKPSENLYGFIVPPLDLTGYGIYNAHSTEIVTAEDNWWNDINGPYHDPNNLDTTGLNVSDNVDFRPWAVGMPAIDNLDHIFDLVITSPGSVDNITSSTPIPFEVNFGESIEGFDRDAEISVTGDYVDDPVVITDEGTGLFTFNLQPEFDAASITVSVAAEAAEDVAGNYNTAQSITITYDAQVAKFIITVSPNPIILWDPFDISVEAVDIYDIRDTDYDEYVALSTNHSDFVNLSSYIHLTNGFGEIETAGLGMQLTDDLDITAAELITNNYLSTLENISVILPDIDPPHGHDGIGDPVVNDVPNDQGGWITLEYGLSQNDPFHPNPVMPYIDSYLVERNSEPDGSGIWETFCTINCYSPNAAGNVTALLNVPEDNTPYPYRMSALYIPGIDRICKNHTAEKRQPGKQEITYLNNEPMDESGYPSKKVYLGRVAGADNIPAYADIKVFLEGAYRGDNMMSSEHLIPTISPYSGIDIERLPEINNNPIIDWIELQLRVTETGETAQRTDAFLLADGSVVSTDGEMCFPFFFTSNIGYYLVIHHRNHLDVMTARDYVLGDSENSITQIELTDRNNVYGNDLKLVDDETFAMYSGDADDNGIIDLEDVEMFNSISIDEKGYFAIDFDMNGYITQTDLENYCYTNIDTHSCVPNSDETLRGGDDEIEPTNSQPENNIPQFIELYNYPNPFNPTTRIEFTLNENEAATLTIYNLKGQVVRNFNIEPNNTQQVHSIVWDGTDNQGRRVTSGVYLYKLLAGTKYTCTKKMILLK